MTLLDVKRLSWHSAGAAQLLLSVVLLASCVSVPATEQSQVLIVPTEIAMHIDVVASDGRTLYSGRSSGPLTIRSDTLATPDTTITITFNDGVASFSTYVGLNGDGQWMRLNDGLTGSGAIGPEISWLIAERASSRAFTLSPETVGRTVQTEVSRLSIIITDQMHPGTRALAVEVP